MKAFPMLLVVVCALAGCGKDATAPDSVAEKMEIVSSPSVNGTVGVAVTDRPSVVVRAHNGNPISGVRVHFVASLSTAVLSGFDVVTDASGRATLGSWILSTTAGQNVVTAYAESLKATFVAVGLAAAPASLSKTSGDDQIALAGSTLQMPLTVVVRDAYDNLVSGALVTFVVTSGDVSPATLAVITDGEGIARASGWTLGASGVQSITANVDGVPPVTFTARVAADDCAPISIPLNALIDSREFGCVLPDGSSASFYLIDTKAQTAFEIAQLLSTFKGGLTLTTDKGHPIGESSSSAGVSDFRAFVPPGKYVLRITSLTSESRVYQLSLKTIEQAAPGCVDTYLALNSDISQALSPGDCKPSGSYPEDHYRVFVTSGTRVVVLMASDEVDNVVSVLDPTGDYVAGTNTSGSYPEGEGARVVFTATKTGYYWVVAATTYFVGRYTLRVLSQ